MMQSSSSSIHGTTSRLIQSVKRLSQDSWSLVLAVARRKTNDTSNIKTTNNNITSIREQWRNALVTQAQQHNNTVAIKWLQWDKSWTLLKYHGPIQYMKQYHSHYLKFPSIDRKSRLGRLIWSDPTLLQQDITTTNNNGSSSITENTTNFVDNETFSKKNNNKVAKVAFMITSQQKLELQDRLGYNTKDIKGLTPMEATIILERNIHRLAEPDEKLQVENSDIAETVDVITTESSSLPHYKIKVASILASMKEEEESLKNECQTQHETASEAEVSSSPEDTSHSTMTMQTLDTTTKKDDMPVAEKHTSLVESKSFTSTSSLNSTSDDTLNKQQPNSSSVVSLSIVPGKAGENNKKQ